MFDLREHPDAVIHEKATLNDALAAIDASSCHLATVTDDEGKLAGILTDGDVRRALLSGMKQSDPIESIIQRKPKTISVGHSDDEAIETLRDTGVEVLPVIDEHRRPVGLQILREMFHTEQNSALPSFGGAVIMAGGEGRRLRPHTATVPKPMIEVGGRPVIDHIVGKLNASGIDDIFVSVNYLADQIKEHLGDGSSRNSRIRYIEETKKLGTAGALSHLDPSQLTGPILVINGDILTTSNFERMFAFHKSTGSALTICVVEHRIQVPYGVVDVRDGLIHDLREKPVQTVHINAGIYLLEPRIIGRIPDDEYFDMTNLIYQCLADEEQVSPFLIHEEWIDIGSSADLAAARQKADEFKGS